MKKVFMIMISMLLVISVCIPSYAVSTSNKNEVSGFELEIVKGIAKLQNKSVDEQAKAILEKAGMSQQMIEMVPESELSEISDCVSVRLQDEYYLVGEDEELELISYDDYLNKKELLENVSTYAQGDSYNYSANDSLLKKTLSIIETKNAPKGTYGVIAGYEWLNFGIRYRGEDVLSFSSEALVFDKSSFGLAVQYTTVQTQNSSSTTNTVVEEYDQGNIKNNKLKLSENAIAVQYNLKNNLTSPTYSLVYTKASMLMICKGRVSQYTSPCVFNVYANYFHQKVGLGSAGMSVSFKGASVSVSPKLFYTQCQICNSSPINYLP